MKLVTIYGERGQKVEPCMNLTLVMKATTREKLAEGVKWLKREIGGWAGGNFLTATPSFDGCGHCVAGCISLLEAERAFPRIRPLIERGMGFSALIEKNVAWGSPPPPHSERP